jgi:hypothetical protein
LKSIRRAIREKEGVGGSRLGANLPKKLATLVVMIMIIMMIIFVL